MTTSRKIVLYEIFRSALTTARVPGGIFQNLYEVETPKSGIIKVHVQDSFDQQLASPKHPTHFTWVLDLENALAIRDVEYTAGQLLRTDNTIIHSNHKMKGSKMWKIRISAQDISKKKYEYANFFSTSVHHVIALIRALKVLTPVDSCCFKSKFYRKDLIDELKIFDMSSRHHIDDSIRGRIIGKIEEGRKITDVAREFDIAHSVVSRLWKSFKTPGMYSRRHGEGRVRSTTPAEDRYIVLSAKRNWRTTAQQVANQFLSASGKQISRKTVARRLRGGGLYARRPVVCVPLTRQHRTARLQWCREHHNWTEQDWT
ncbi:transposable element Tcb2 transposase [Trichonephila clavipes]|nr:transposable element Tcb2 transposase [Trichonephila clavipes]